MTTDATYHWKVCARSGCTEQLPYGEHVYDNACDTTCNACGHVRSITHNYSNSWSSDSTGHWYACTVCGDKKDFAAHTPGAAATEATPQTCTICGYVLEAQTVVPLTTHNYGADGKCTVCGSMNPVQNITVDNVDDLIEAATIGGETVEVENVTVEQYLDLSVVLVASGTDVGNLTATDEPVTFSVSLDEDLVAELEGKVVFVLRIHGDDVTLLPATLDENGVLTFTTDKFSTYAIVTADPVEDPGHDDPTPPYRPWPWWTPTNPSHGGSGSGTTTTTTSGKSFTTNLNGITAVYVDGKKIDSKYYTVNGKVITLTDEFLKTLPDGKHTLKAESATGVATATFSTSNGTALKSAATGDAGMALYAAMGVMSLMGMGWVGKKRHN